MSSAIFSTLSMRRVSTNLERRFSRLDLKASLSNLVKKLPEESKRFIFSLLMKLYLLELKKLSRKKTALSEMLLIDGWSLVHADMFHQLKFISSKKERVFLLISTKVFMLETIERALLDPFVERPICSKSMKNSGPCLLMKQLKNSLATRELGETRPD